VLSVGEPPSGNNLGKKNKKKLKILFFLDCCLTMGFWPKVLVPIAVLISLSYTITDNDSYIYNN